MDNHARRRSRFLCFTLPHPSAASGQRAWWPYERHALSTQTDGNVAIRLCMACMRRDAWRPRAAVISSAFLCGRVFSHTAIRDLRWPFAHRYDDDCCKGLVTSRSLRPHPAAIGPSSSTSEKFSLNVGDGDDDATLFQAMTIPFPQRD